ncbi:MAG: hypothetical protein OQK73_06325 [Gammaproteobacteria bacterium]|nr:hypothetical protein [Gammaproteobacteria bacterium]
MFDIPGRLINKIRRYFHFRPILAEAENTSKRLLTSGKHKHIMVICYGNIYRSPFVEQYLKKNSQDKLLKIQSAGTYPKSNRSSPEKHILMSKEFGLDLAEHRSVVADEALLGWADIIVIMDRHNWTELEKYGETVTNKIVWLGSLSGSNIEIKDPYGMIESEAMLILKKLEYCSAKLINYL